jgi:hypothetical protein
MVGLVRFLSVCLAIGDVVEPVEVSRATSDHLAKRRLPQIKQLAPAHLYSNWTNLSRTVFAEKSSKKQE